MSGLIEDVLDVVRARLAGGIPVTPAAVELGALVERVIGEHRTAHPERKIEVHRHGPLDGRWDADRLAQVISNLVGNAIQHGSAARPIDLRVDGTNGEVVTIDVENGGVIPPELIGHLFDPFRGAQREPGRHGGLGLGLYIVKQVIDAHGGRVEVKSEGDTTRFRVVLPRVPTEHQ